MPHPMVSSLQRDLDKHRAEHAVAVAALQSLKDAHAKRKATGTRIAYGKSGLYQAAVAKAMQDEKAAWANIASVLSCIAALSSEAIEAKKRTDRRSKVLRAIYPVTRTYGLLGTMSWHDQAVATKDIVLQSFKSVPRTLGIGTVLRYEMLYHLHTDEYRVDAGWGLLYGPTYAFLRDAQHAALRVYHHTRTTDTDKDTAVTLLKDIHTLADHACTYEARHGASTYRNRNAHAHDWWPHYVDARAKINASKPMWTSKHIEAIATMQLTLDAILRAARTGRIS